MLDIIGITCAATYDRLQGFCGSLKPLVSANDIRGVRLVLNHDIPLHDESMFDETLWSSHLADISHILMLNIARSNRVSLDSLAFDTSRFFPPRRLKAAEKSLLLKHYKALSIGTNMSLILEDDARFKNESNDLDSLLEVIRYAETTESFLDFGEYPGLQSRGSQVFISNDIAVYQLPVACTRTTVAYALPIHVRRRMIECYWPCSLPADLHHQYLLNKLRIPGLWPVRSFFHHLSFGEVSSSIQ